MIVKTEKNCRVCGSSRLIPVLSLGEQFVVNFVDNSEKNKIKAPLELVLCDPNYGCGLLQLKHTLDHDVLYRKYWYKSGISTTMVKALADVVSSAQKMVNLSSGEAVVDIGSNDGTLLRQYNLPGVITVGFEPSDLYKIGAERISIIVNDYFNKTAFEKALMGKKAKIITSIAMFYDLEDPNSFVEDIKACLQEDGLWIIQMNYLGLMIENNTFDNISHEHLEYYSLLSLEYLLKKHDMEAVDVELNNVNGGSFRIYVRHKGGKIEGFMGADNRLIKLRNQERKLGLSEIETYDAFAKRIMAIRRDVVSFLKKENKKGKKILIYGASTRGLVMLQYFGIDNRLVEAAADMNSDKWGKHIVGTGIPIISVEEYRKEKPDYLLVLPYHFIEEIKKQEEVFLDNGGKMIVALPEFKVVSRTD